MMDPCTIALQTDKQLMAIHNRQELQDAYINQVLDDMDLKTMWAVLFDFMDADMDKYTDEELMTEIKEYYPELLEE